MEIAIVLSLREVVGWKKDSQMSTSGVVAGWLKAKSEV